MRLKEHGAAQLRLHSKHGRVESLKVAWLQDAPVLLGQCNKIVGLRKRPSQRLFDEKINACIKKR